MPGMSARQDGGANMSTEVQLSETLSGFRMNIRAVVRGLWKGFIDRDQFFDGMMRAIQRGFNQAAQEGAKQFGVTPSEFTPEERLALEAVINTQLQFIAPFGQFVEENSQVNGGKLGRSFARAQMWINQYNSVKNQAAVSAAGDRKMIWLLGATEEHCTSCLKLHKKVKRASFWQKQGVRPQNAPNESLECGGWKCDCDLVPTDEPLSRGPLPGLP